MSRFVHAGHVLVAALALRTEDEACGAYEPGARVVRAGAHIFVIFVKPRRLRTDTIVGIPLVEVGGILASHPLKHAPSLPGTIEMAIAGEILSYPPSHQRTVSLAGGLDFGDVAILDSEPLRAPQAVTPVAIDRDTKTINEVLPTAPPPSPARQALLRAMRGEIEEARPGLVDFYSGLRGWFSRLFTRTSTAPASGAYRPTSRAPWGRIVSWLDRWLLASSFARVLSRKHGRFLARMLEAFERGELGEALRNAIPLNKETSDTLQAWMPLRLARRPDLQFTTRGTGGAGIGLGLDGYALLQQTYRRAFERLDREGRIDEAAFVLGELLDCAADAVAYLEKHGRHRQAAELADLKGLAIGLRIRLWVAAGDDTTAIAIAVRHSAFAEAIHAVTDLDLRRKIRRWWASELVKTNDIERAIQVLWESAELQAEASPLIALLEDQETPVGARMLARRIALEGATEARKPRLRDVLREKTRQLWRLAFARELAMLNATPAIAGAAAMTLRYLYHHGEAGMMSPRELEGLTQRSSYVEIFSDLRGATQPVPEALPRTTRVEHTLATKGTMRIYDIAPLPHGRILVALGEGGVQLRRSNGSLVRHYGVPATRLSVADHGNACIAMVRRDTITQLSRIDLVRHNAQRWCDVEIEAHADSHDGRRWLVAAGDAVHLIDVTASAFASLWSVTNLGQTVTRLDARRGGLYIVTSSFDGPALLEKHELWRYDPSTLVLRERSDYDPQLFSEVYPYALAATDEGMRVIRGHGDTVFEARFAGAQHIVGRAVGTDIAIADEHGRIVVVQDGVALGIVI